MLERVASIRVCKGGNHLFLYPKNEAVNSKPSRHTCFGRDLLVSKQITPSRSMYSDQGIGFTS